MKTSIEFDHEKATQAINFFARREPGLSIDKMKAIKLIWLADRYHLRRYGRPIIKDTYFAFQRGPAPSAVMNLTEGSDYLSPTEKGYADKFLKPYVTSWNVKSIGDVDLDVFSESDIEVLELIGEEYGGYKSSTLSTLSHKFPEWSKFKEAMDSGSTRKEMSYSDFFLNPDESIKFGKNIFNESQSRLKKAKEIFEESYEVANFWV